MKSTCLRQIHTNKSVNRVFLSRLFVILFALVNFADTAFADPKAFVTNSGDDTVTVISLTTMTVVATIPVGDNPLNITVSPDGGRAYVSNRNSSNVSIIDTDTLAVIATVSVGTAPTGLAWLAQSSAAV